MFWKRFHEEYITEADIRKMAEEGLNSVRLAINSRHIIEDDEPLRWKDDGIARIDRLIEWCRSYQLYVILDLHGAPGGQTGANIDDSEHDQPGCFSRTKCVTGRSGCGGCLPSATRMNGL